MVSDVPLRSAVIIAHDPHGAQPILKGGCLSPQAAHQLDYNSRSGVWEERGGCDRESTHDDESAAELASTLARQLDYVSRTGGFEHKDEGRQVDATFFGQRGAVSREQVEGAMRSAGEHGGCFMKSILTVDRRYASDLNLDTKESFERLLRATWSRAVCEWGVTDDPSEVRWVANYHTDAENSLHVHITTWLRTATPSKGFERGWTVGAEETRAAKELVYKAAYRPVLLQMDREKDLYRDLARAQVRAELNVEQDPAMIARILSKSQALGIAPEIKRTVDDPDALRLRGKLDDLAMSWDFHKGSPRSVAKDRWMMSAARDVLKDLEEHAPGYARIVEAWRENCERRADAHGLAVGVAPHDLGDSTAEATPVTQRERDRYLRPMIDDLRSRTATMLAGDVRDRALPARLEHEVTRSASNAAYDDLRALARSGVDAATAARELAASPLVREAASRAIAARADQYGSFGITAEQALARALPIVERKLVRRIERARRADDPKRERPLSRDAIQRVLRGDYAHLGLSKSGIDQLRADVAAGNYTAAARTVQSSPAFERKRERDGCPFAPRDAARSRAAINRAMERSAAGDLVDTTVSAVITSVLSIRAADDAAARRDEERPRTEEARRAREQKYADYSVTRTIRR